MIHEALRDWKQKRMLRLQNIDELSHLWEAGINSGSGQYGDIDIIKQQARKRYNQMISLILP